MTTDFQKLIDEAEKLTDEQTDSRLSSLIKLTDSELSELCPKKPDKVRLAELMMVVREAKNENEKRDKIIENINVFAGTIVGILNKVV
jgi:hypothetical protein